MKESFKWQNQKEQPFKKVAQKLLNKAGNNTEQLAIKLNVQKSTISKWLNGQELPSDKNIKNIISTFGLTEEDVGVKRIILKDTGNTFSKSLNKLMKEKGIKQANIVKDLSFDKGTVSNWCAGRSEPKGASLKKLADYLGVSTSYLKGETNIKNADNQIVFEKLGIDDFTGQTMQEQKNNEIYGKKLKEEVKEDFGFDEADVRNFLINDTQLLDIFYYETLRVLSYYTNSQYTKDFDALLNTIELDLVPEEGVFATTDFESIYKVSPTLIGKSVLSQKIQMMFEDFIDDITRKNNLEKYRENELIKIKEKHENEIKIINDLLNNIDKK